MSEILTSEAIDISQPETLSPEGQKFLKGLNSAGVFDCVGTLPESETAEQEEIRTQWLAARQAERARIKEAAGQDDPVAAQGW